MAILEEMWNIVMRVFGGADSISLIIMLVVVVAAGMMLGEQRRIIQVTVGALAIYGLARLGYTIITQDVEPMTVPTTAWNDLKVMAVGDLVVYFLAFAIVISVIHGIRNAVNR
jgi:predicted neutral ceramidase superfamily lipid hydrolase